MTAASGMIYDNLVTDIQTYAERDDTPFTDQIPRFIMLAQTRLISQVRGLGTISYFTNAFTPSNPVIAKPDGWRENVSFSFVDASNQRHYLFEREYEYCRAYWPDQTVTTTTPKYYANYDYEHFIIAGTPATALSFEIACYVQPTRLSSSQQTNWYTQYAPQLLLAACLLEAQPFLKLDERIQVFQKMYDDALANVMNEAKRRAIDRANVRTEA